MPCNLVPYGEMRLAFVHVPKTAGTSVTEALSVHFGTQACPAMTTLDYPLYNADQLLRYRFFKGHAYRRDYERLPPGTKKFTILRDPVDRALSYYRYYRGMAEDVTQDPFAREAIRLAHSQSVTEFVYSDSPFLIEHVRLGQMRQFLTDDCLAAIGHRQFLSRALKQRVVEEFSVAIAGFDHVLTVESLALSYPLLARSLGLPDAPLSFSNASVAGDAVDRQDLLRALVDVDGPEFECYELVRRREIAWLAAALPA